LASINSVFAGAEDLSPRTLLSAFNRIFFDQDLLGVRAAVDEKAFIFSSCSHQRFVKVKENEGICSQSWVSQPTQDGNCPSRFSRGLCHALFPFQSYVKWQS
jgi:hypothetical protein